MSSYRTEQPSASGSNGLNGVHPPAGDSAGASGWPPQAVEAAQAAQQAPQAPPPNGQAPSPPQPPEVPDPQYQMTPAGAEALEARKDKQGRLEYFWIPLTNFAAYIVGLIEIEDGSGEVRQELVLETSFAGQVKTIRVAADQFDSLDWAAREVSPRASYFPRRKDAARHAIRVCSPEHWTWRIASHTGWVEYEAGKWCYLHAAGGIGADGPVAGAATKLGDGLTGFVLPDPPTDPAPVRAALGASLGLLNLAPLPLTAPLLASVFLAPLTRPDFSLHLSGRSGVLKTAIAALAQQHYGASLGARNLPGAWASTAASLEFCAFVMKDALMVIDDFAPSPDPRQARAQLATAERIFRATGNSAGRGRARPDGTPIPTRAPRCLVLSTGEDAPFTASIMARLLVLAVKEGDVNLSRLTAAQQAADAGLLAQAMALWIAHLARDLPAARAEYARRQAQLLPDATGAHRRTPQAIAALGAALAMVVDFAKGHGVAVADEADLWTALTTAGTAQASHSEGSDPARRFLSLIGALLRNRQAYLLPHRGEASLAALALDAFDNGMSSWLRMPGDERTEPGARCIGRFDPAASLVLLDPDTAFAAASRLAVEQQNHLGVTAKALWSRLAEAGLLAQRDPTRNTFKVRLQEGTVNMIAISLDRLRGEVD